jgi:hypothetical protein
MIMALVFFRMMVCLLCGLSALAGGLILLAIDGDAHRACGLVVTCALVAWMAAPDPEERAAFDEFQKQRLAKHGIKSQGGEHG